MTRKHEVNIKRSKWITFQLWIIAVLSFSYFMYEVSMYSKPAKNIANNTYSVNDTSNDPDEMYGGVETYNDPVVEVKPKPVKISVDLPAEIIKNDAPEIKAVTEEKTNPNKQPVTKSKITSTHTSTKTAPSSSTSTGVKKPTIYSPRTVDFLPVFPGCDKYSTNAERAACFEKKIKRLVRKKFNNRIGNELGLQGKQRIMLYFEIDQNGVVSNIKANSKGHIFDLEKEAIRVAKKIPTMQPARAGNEKVKMAYSIPIVFDAL